MTTRLLRKARGGEREALEALYVRIGSRLLAVVRLRLDPELARLVEAEDVVQEVLLRAFRHIERFEQDSSRSFFAWLARIASTTINDLRAYHRQQKRDARLTEPIEASGREIRDLHRGISSQLVIEEELARLEGALAAMKPEHREVILLRRFEERSFSEIGAVMNRSEDASRMLYTRAMAALAKRMTQ